LNVTPVDSFDFTVTFVACVSKCIIVAALMTVVEYVKSVGCAVTRE